MAATDNLNGDQFASRKYIPGNFTPGEHASSGVRPTSAASAGSAPSDPTSKEYVDWHNATFKSTRQSQYNAMVGNVHSTIERARQAAAKGDRTGSARLLNQAAHQRQGLASFRHLR
jgi:hypothetical protein